MTSILSLKIGAIAQRLGTTVRTLRFYEENGLVHPGRTPGGTRLYTEANEASRAVASRLEEMEAELEQRARAIAEQRQDIAVLNVVWDGAE